MTTDRVALVTGAARGQGAAIVRRLHKDGFRVAACDLMVDDVKATVDALGDDAVIAIPLNVTDADQWAAAVATAVARFGALSTLVNNAGVLHWASLSDETAAGFEGSWRVNCLGPFLGIQTALPHLRESEGASIVNTCSTGAIRPFPNHAAYGSSKWALRGLTQVTAAELAASGIRVNAVFPGPVDTPCSTRRRRRVSRNGPCWAGWASRWRSPTPWRFWCPSRHPSSPVRSSSSTEANACKPDDRQGIFSRNHRRGPGRVGAGHLPEQGWFSRLHDLRPRRRRGRHMADQHLPGPGLRREIAPVFLLIRYERELVAAVVGSAGDPGLLRAVHTTL